MIDGVKVKRLKVVPDERGRLMEILRNDDDIFSAFGQVYISTTRPGVVKAWHKHERQDDNICCVHGMLKLVLYDGREESPSNGEIAQFFLGIHNPILVHVPRGVWHGWKCVGAEEAIAVNTPTEPYDRKRPDEQRLDPHGATIPYDWARVDG